MQIEPRSKDHSPHVTDEVINTTTHLVAACFAVLGAALVITQAAIKKDPWTIVGVSIYSATLINLFIFSTLHHGVNGSTTVNRRLRTFDYISVFLLIAGTITPLVLTLFRDAYGWAVFGAVWLIAATGIVLRSVFTDLPKYITNSMYIVLGWIPLALLFDNSTLPIGGLLLLGLGGALYSCGFYIYVREKPNPRPGRFGFHEIWHILVALAAAMHFLLIYLFVVRR